jgi:choline kinase
MLDSRGPPGQYDVEEAAREEHVAKEVDHLIKETRLWRVANSAQWVAWGIVQAKIPDMEEELEAKRRGKATDQGKSYAPEPSDPFKDSITDEIPESETGAAGKESSTNDDADAKVEVEPEFDYLAYAQQRAFFFWGDLLELGLIKEEDLPENVLREAKRVPY